MIDQGRLWVTRAGAPVAHLTSAAVASIALLQFLAAVPIIAAIHAWPIGLAALTRCARWPQFVRPLAVTLAAFAFRPLYLLTGLIAGTLLSGNWQGLAYFLLLLLDPVTLAINLSILMFGLFLARAAWRADREYRRLVPDGAESPDLPGPFSAARRWLPRLSSVWFWHASASARAIWSPVIFASRPRSIGEQRRLRLSTTPGLRPSVGPRAGRAHSESSGGCGSVLRRGRAPPVGPARAEDHFRKVPPLWEGLVRDTPSNTDYQIGLEPACTILAFTVLAQGRPAEAREQLTRSAAQWECWRPVHSPRRSGQWSTCIAT